MRRRLGVLLLSSVLVACAGITGLGDYAIDDGTPDAAVAETGTRADGTTVVTPAEGGTSDVVIPRDGTITTDAEPPLPPDCNTGPCDIITSTDVADVTVTDTALYWLDAKQKSVRTAELDGSNPHDLVTGEDAAKDVRALAASNGYVGWFSGSQLRRAPIGGGAASNVTTYPGPSFSSVACMKKSAVTSNVHFIVSAAAYKVDLAAGNANPDVAISPGLVGVGVVGNGTDLFFTETGGGIYDRTTNGSFSPTKLVDNQSEPECIELADGFLFWANHGSGELVRSTMDGKTHSAIATGQSGIHGVSTNKTHVYWSHAGGIRRLKR